MYGRCTRLTLVAVIPVTVGLIVLGPRIVTTVFGEDYAGSGAPLRVLAIYGAAAALAAPAISLFKAMGRVRVAIVVVLAQSALAFVLLVVLVASNEIVGAAWAVTIPAVLGAIALVAAAHRTTGASAWGLLVDCRYALVASLVFTPCVVAAAAGLASGAMVAAFGIGTLAFAALVLRVDPDLARLLRGMRPHRVQHAEAA
jgi:O-antigen/teichoic acid export membrane protein